MPSSSSTFRWAPGASPPGARAHDRSGPSRPEREGTLRLASFHGHRRIIQQVRQPRFVDGVTAGCSTGPSTCPATSGFLQSDFAHQVGRTPCPPPSRACSTPEPPKKASEGFRVDDDRRLPKHPPLCPFVPPQPHSLKCRCGRLPAMIETRPVWLLYFLEREQFAKTGAALAKKTLTPPKTPVLVDQTADLRNGLFPPPT